MKRLLIMSAALLVIVTGIVAGESSSDDITPPRVVARVNPHYPDAAKRKGIQGQVVMSVTVSKQGSAQKVVVVEGLPGGGEGLDDAAVDAVRQWKFEPAKKSGEPVDAELQLTIAFKL